MLQVLKGQPVSDSHAFVCSEAQTAYQFSSLFFFFCQGGAVLLYGGAYISKDWSLQCVKNSQN